MSRRRARTRRPPARRSRVRGDAPQGRAALGRSDRHGDVRRWDDASDPDEEGSGLRSGRNTVDAAADLRRRSRLATGMSVSGQVLFDTPGARRARRKPASARRATDQFVAWEHEQPHDVHVRRARPTDERERAGWYAQGISTTTAYRISHRSCRATTWTPEDVDPHRGQGRDGESGPGATGEHRAVAHVRGLARQPRSRCASSIRSGLRRT